MKTKFIGILVIAICIPFFRCKSPKGTKPTEETNASPIDTNKVVEATGDTSGEEAKSGGSGKPLTVIIKNLASATAPVTVSVYGTKNKFPAPKHELKIYKFKPHGKSLTAKISDLKYGTYAIATYQDVNKNGKIDQNLIGIPKEPYAFSNNYEPTIKAPNFDDCRFDYNEKSCLINIKMIR